MEEAYLATTSLPWGLEVKAGRIFAPWGRINTQHPHAWDFVDGPLARGRVLAAETLAGPGLDVAWLAPLPWFAELHLAAQSLAPGEGDEERLTGVVRLAQFFPLGDETTLGVGLSAARRDEGPGALELLGWAILAPLIAMLLQMAVSRSREFGADATGAAIAGDPEPLAQALLALERGNELVPYDRAGPATAHLYIVNPLHGRAFASLLSTHPPIEERVKRLRELRRGVRFA